MAQQHGALDECEWLTPDARDFVAPIRNAVMNLDGASLDPFHTDHSSEHCERVLATLTRILEVAAPAKRLTETEGMILAAATYLHDVGMYYGRSPYDDATMRREHTTN